jgi:hypothetical protein
MRIVFKMDVKQSLFLTIDLDVLFIQPQKMNIGIGENKLYIIWVSSRGVGSEGKNGALAPPGYFDI